MLCCMALYLRIKEAKIKGMKPSINDAVAYDLADVGVLAPRELPKELIGASPLGTRQRRKRDTSGSEEGRGKRADRTNTTAASG